MPINHINSLSLPLPTNNTKTVVAVAGSLLVMAAAVSAVALIIFCPFAAPILTYQIGTSAALIFFGASAVSGTLYPSVQLIKYVFSKTIKEEAVSSESHNTQLSGVPLTPPPIVGSVVAPQTKADAEATILQQEQTSLLRKSPLLSLPIVGSVFVAPQPKHEAAATIIQQEQTSHLGEPHLISPETVRPIEDASQQKVSVIAGIPQQEGALSLRGSPLTLHSVSISDKISQNYEKIMIPAVTETTSPEAINTSPSPAPLMTRVKNTVARCAIPIIFTATAAALWYYSNSSTSAHSLVLEITDSQELVPLLNSTVCKVTEAINFNNNILPYMTAIVATGVQTLTQETNGGYFKLGNNKFMFRASNNECHRQDTNIYEGDSSKTFIEIRKDSQSGCILFSVANDKKSSPQSSLTCCPTKENTELSCTGKVRLDAGNTLRKVEYSAIATSTGTSEKVCDLAEKSNCLEKTSSVDQRPTILAKIMSLIGELSLTEHLKRVWDSKNYSN